MPFILACGLCPLRITMSGKSVVPYWWCPNCGCWNTRAPETP